MHNADRLFDVLSRLADTTVEAVRFTEPCFKSVNLKVGEHFIRAGDTPRYLAFVEQGLFRFYYSRLDGTEFVKSFCVAGEFVGAYSAMLMNEPARFYIEALEDSVIALIAYADFDLLCDQYLIWQKIRLHLTEALYIKKEQRESSLLLDDAQTRYLKFRQQYPHLEQRVKQYHIASYLGITPVSLSRIRTQLKQN